MTEAEKVIAEIKKEIACITHFIGKKYDPWGHIDLRHSIERVIQRLLDYKDPNHATVIAEKDAEIERLKQQLAGEPTIVETDDERQRHSEMTREKAIEKLLLAQNNKDTEVAHADADAIICSLLCELGYADVVSEYYKVSKWYA